MTRIVRSTYRYKRPPGKRKAVRLAGPEVVTIRDKRRRVPAPTEPATEPVAAPPAANDDRKPVIVRGKKRVALAASVTGSVVEPVEAAAPVAQEARPSVIVTVRNPGKPYRDVPDVTSDEHRRRGDAAAALFREIKRRIADR